MTNATITPDDLDRYIALGRTLAATACDPHGKSPALWCSSCRADSYADGGQDRRERTRIEAMARCDAVFPRRYRDARTDQPEVVAWIDEAARDLDRAPSLLLVGAPNTGKTHAGFAALRRVALAHPPATVLATTFPDFFAALRPQQGVDSEAVMRRHRTADLVLIDDVGTAKGSEWVEEVTYRLVNGRYEAMRPTIFTTNLSISQLKVVIGDRITGRLAETCVMVEFAGIDWRRRRPV